jgi:hypothetical protein
MILIIGFCLTGCQRQKYLNWIDYIDYLPGTLVLCFTDKAKTELVGAGGLEIADKAKIMEVYGDWEMFYLVDGNDIPTPGIVSATVRVGENEYTSNDYYIALDVDTSKNLNVNGIRGMAINFPELADIDTVKQSGKSGSLNSSGIDSLTITFIDKNNEEITVIGD